MPKSEFPKAKRATKASRMLSPPAHFPSKPYMRALRAQSPTSVPTAAWSTTDDELLLRSKSSGKKWVEISPLFPGKTSNACRKRHARLVTHAQVEWDEFKERDLAVQFVNAKVGFFKTIAGNLKLEWRQVEKKCLELGFKALLEKGKKLAIPFPPGYEQPEIEGATRDELARQALPTSLEIKPLQPASTTPDVKIPLHLESSDGGSDIPQSRPPKTLRRPRTARTELVVAGDGDLEEDISRDGGDEMDDDDLNFQVPVKGECMNEGPEPKG